jgi:hypothetical protein
VTDHVKVPRSTRSEPLQDTILPDTLREIVEARILSLISPDGQGRDLAVETAQRIASKVIVALKGGERSSCAALERASAQRGERPTRKQHQGNP